MKKLADKIFEWVEEIGKTKEWARETFSLNERDEIFIYRRDEGISIQNCPKLLKIPSFFKEIDAVRTLSFYNTPIEKIENLPEGLIVLTLDKSKVSKIENLPEGLRWLHLRSTPITKIENLPETLQHLYIENSPILSIENLSKDLIVFSFSIDNIRLIGGKSMCEVVESLPFLKGVKGHVILKGEELDRLKEFINTSK